MVVSTTNFDISDAIEHFNDDLGSYNIVRLNNNGIEFKRIVESIRIILASDNMDSYLSDINDNYKDVFRRIHNTHQRIQPAFMFDNASSLEVSYALSMIMTLYH